MRDIFANGAIAARCREHEFAFFIGADDLQAVDFQFQIVRCFLANESLDTLIECFYFFFGERVVEGPLRDLVPNFLQFRQRLARHDLCR